MSQPSYATISEALAAGLEATVGVKVVQEQTSITEAVSDLPTIQVYFQDDEQQGEVDRATFQKGVYINTTTWFVDVYAHERGVIGENIATCYQIGQAVKEVLDAQCHVPFFTPSVKAKHYRAERLQLETATQNFMAMRFTLTLWLYPLTGG